MANDFIRRIAPFMHNIQSLYPVATEIQPVVMRDTTIKAIVFDIYGTLVVSASGDLDKSSITVENINQAIIKGGFKWMNKDYEEDAGKLLGLFHQAVIDQQNELKQVGFPYPEVDIIKVWKGCIEKATELKMVAPVKDADLKVLTVVFELLSNQIWPMPRMKEVLFRFFDSAIPTGIVSNAQFYTPILMNYFLWDEISEQEQIRGFNADVSIFSYQINRSKPDVYLFDQLAASFKNNYQLSPGEVLFIGNDMLKDVWTAKQAGFKTALFAADKRSLRWHSEDERCSKLTPDFIVTDLSQLFEIVKF